jgi:LacI family transcriptional regulator
MAHQEKDLPLDTRLVAWLPPKVFQTAQRMQEAMRLTATLLEANPAIDALFVHDDVVALGVLKLCRLRSLAVPRDIAIVSFDDILLASMVHPPLTTVAIPKQELGAKAMQLLEDLADEKDLQNAEIVIDPHLVVRESA